MSDAGLSRSQGDAAPAAREVTVAASRTDAPARFEAPPFIPRPFLSNGHLQTIVGNFLSRADTLPPPVPELVETSPATGSQIATQVLCECNWHPAAVRATRPTVILVHGLEGSSQSRYMVGNANKMWRAGANVIRMNMRNCGGTERLTPTLYNSSLSSDVGAVLRHFVTREHLQSVALVGYSMGGNLVMKLAGELGTGPVATAVPQLHSAVVVSPAIDLGPSADALHRPANRLYERRFLRAMIQRFRLKATLFPQMYDPTRAIGIRSLREYDDRIMTFYSGFRSADDYYYRASAARVVDSIRVPMLVLHALDDPFVRITPPTRAALVANPCITLMQSAHGGHCAFLSRPGAPPGDDGHWAEATLLRFILAHA